MSNVFGERSRYEGKKEKKTKEKLGGFLGDRWSSMDRGLRYEKVWGVCIWQMVAGAGGDLAIMES